MLAMTGRGHTRLSHYRIAWISAGLWAMLACAAASDLQSGVDAYTAGNFTEAVGHFRPLAEAGDPQAQFNMGVLAFKGHGVPRDLVASYAWLTASGRQGFVFACRYRNRVRADMTAGQVSQALVLVEDRLARAGASVRPPGAPGTAAEDWCPERDSNPRPTP